MTLELWLVYLAAAVGLSLTPGPNGLLALTHGGIIGFVILVALSISGLGALLAASERAFMMVKWAGAAYLVYLGVRLWLAPSPLVDAEAAVRSAAAPRSRLAGIETSWGRFRQGLLVALSNPKALLFFAAFLPQFMVPDTSLWLQFVVLGGTFALVELLYELLVAAMAGRLAGWLGRYGLWFNRLAGATFIAIGALLARAER